MIEGTSRAPWQIDRIAIAELNTSDPTNLPSVPGTRESIRPRTPDVAFGNVLATTNNRERNWQPHWE